MESIKLPGPRYKRFSYVDRLMSPQIVVISAYVAGQGSFFAVMLVLSALERVDLATQIAYLCLITSLGAQIADVGNAGGVVPAIRRNTQGSEVSALIFTKLAVAVAVAAAFIAISWALNDSVPNNWLSIVTPLFLILMSFSPAAQIEADGKYASIGLIGALQWLIPVILGLAIRDSEVVLFISSFILIIVTHYIAAPTSTFQFFRNIRQGLTSSLGRVAPGLIGNLIVIACSALLGQLWWRWIALDILNQYGKTEFNALSTSRGIIVGWIMVLSLWIRVRFTSIVGKTNIEDLANVPLRDLIAPVSFSAAVTAGFIVFYGFTHFGNYGTTLRPIACMLLWLSPAAWLWIFCFPRLLASQYYGSPRRNLLSELSSSVVMVAAYYSLAKLNFVIALSISDSVKMLCATYVVTRQNIQRSGASNDKI